MRKLIIILFACIQNSVSVSQNGSLTDETKHVFDSIYGADNLLINGRLYTYSNYKAKGNPFFFGDDPMFCTVFINQRTFTNLWVNYDIVEDKLILLTNINNIKLNIELNNHLIDSFNISHLNYIEKRSNINPYQVDILKDTIFTKKFINSKQLGFYEQIKTTDYEILIKYQKKFSTEVSEDNPYGEYTEQKRYLYFKKENDLIEITKQKEFLRIFKNEKKEIKRFLKKHKIKYKKAEYKDFKNLLNYCQKIR